MAITSGFFDSVNGDRTYDAEQMSSYFDGLISDGVYENIGDRFAVTSANDGMTVNVGTGRAVIQSHWVKNDATVVMTLDPSDVQLNRTDFIVLRLDRTNRTIELTVKKGSTSTGDPGIAPPTRTSTVWEMYLAAVRINKGATQPTYITDMRPSSYCGWVTGIITQVDTSDLFTQWETAYAKMYAAFDLYMQTKQAEFNAWFQTLTKELTVETGITKLEYRVTVGAGSNSFGIELDDYNMDEDVVLAFMDGVYIAEGYDYEIKKRPHYPYPMGVLTNGKTVPKATTFTVVVFKNVIGKSVLTVGSSVPMLSGAVGTGGVSEIVEEES